MDGETEVLQHSNRPIALVLTSLLAGLAIWLVASNYDPEPPEISLPVPTTGVPVPTTAGETATTPTTAGWILDRSPGIDWWSSETEEGETDPQIFHLGDGVTILVTSFAEVDQRAPVVRRIDALSRTILWTARGRSGARWPLGSPTRADGTILISDYGLTPVGDGFDSTLPSGSGILHGFDAENGSVRFASPYDVVPVDGRAANVVGLADGDLAVLVQVDPTGLSRIDPLDGSIQWQSELPRGRVLGSSLIGTGEWAIAVAGPDGTVLLNTDTGTVTGSRERSPAPPDCVAGRGSRVAVVLFTEEANDSCVLVAGYQSLEIWNKGFDRLTVDWPPGGTGELTIASDGIARLGSIRRILTPGANALVATPYPMPRIWLMLDGDSPSNSFELNGGQFGPAAPGMTLAEASQALGLELRRDTEDPSCRIAGIVGDPYSPRFLLSRSGAGDTISSIVSPQVQVRRPC